MANLNSSPRSTWHTARLTLLLAVAPLLLASCITDHLANPAATQPATAIDPATTQPSYWLDQPAVAHIDAPDFDSLWHACEQTARGYLFDLDRQDFRLGLLTTIPMVSKQIWEFWRKDAGTPHEVWQDSLQTIRRTLRFQLRRNDDGTYTATPKVLVENENVLEHRLSSVTEYRGAFSGGQHTSSIYSSDTLTPVPHTYWTPIGRDRAMEKQVAAVVERQLRRQAEKPRD